MSLLNVSNRNPYGSILMVISLQQQASFFFLPKLCNRMLERLLSINCFPNTSWHSLQSTERRLDDEKWGPDGSLIWLLLQQTHLLDFFWHQRVCICIPRFKLVWSKDQPTFKTESVYTIWTSGSIKVWFFNISNRCSNKK